MKILIDGQTLLTPELKRGIGKYFLNIIENLLSADFANEFYLAVPSTTNLDVFSPWAAAKLQIVDLSVNGHGRREMDARSHQYSNRVNDVIFETGMDVYWSPNALMDSVFLPARLANTCRYCVTIFDLIPLVMEEHFKKSWPPRMFARYRRKLAMLETDYDVFFHISQHTYNDFSSRLAVARKHHAVTPLAVDDSFRPYPFPKVPDAEDYLLYPGGFDPRKNMNGALEAFAELHRRHGHDESVRRTRLKLACHVDAAAERDIRKRAQRLGIDEKLHVTGFVSDEELIQLYQKARCLFFPSLYEGFGLPVLEGLACGLPVAASNTSSIPEVAGDMASYFDPYDSGNMADALYRTLQEPRDLASRTRRHEHARRFSWAKTAAATLHAWNDTTATSTE